jgi:peptide/nickel transport system substrate-binding protein
VSAPTPASSAVPARLTVSQIEETRDLASIDPLKTMDTPVPTLLVFDTLVRRTPGGEVTPLLAEKIERVDPKTWRFRLRDGVKFHDGSPLVAEDMAATLANVMDPKNGSSYVRHVATVEKVEVKDARTVDLLTRVPTDLLPAFLSVLPIAPSVLVKDGSYKTKLVGTGPYTLADWRQGESVLLRRNPSYWGAAPAYQEVLVKAVGEPSTRLADLLSGSAGIAGDLLPEHVPQLRAKGMTVVRESGVRTAYIAFSHKPPTDDPRIRQAFYHALDRKALATTAFGDYAEPAISAVPKSFSGYAEAFPLTDYDPAKAKALVQAAGKTAPVRITLDTTAEMSPVAQLIQAQARDAGFDVQINMVDSRATLFDAKRLMASAEGRAFMTTALDNRMFDALRPLDTVYGANSFMKQYGYQPDPRNQPLIDRYTAEPDAQKRRDLSLEVQRNGKEGMPVVWLYYPDHLFGVAPGVCWTPGGLGQITYWDVKPC